MEFEYSSVTDDDMDPLLSEFKSNSKPFSDMQKNKEEDSELANMEEVQPIKLNPLITIGLEST